MTIRPEKLYSIPLVSDCECACSLVSVKFGSGSTCQDVSSNVTEHVCRLVFSAIRLNVSCCIGSEKLITFRNIEVNISAELFIKDFHRYITVTNVTSFRQIENPYANFEFIIHLSKVKSLDSFTVLKFLLLSVLRDGCKVFGRCHLVTCSYN
uniref:Uncharacterized protein n=1 Tax=Schistocephalus solidus TaxID=70667 RepID=A0A0V0J2T5_SCHSO